MNHSNFTTSIQKSQELLSAITADTGWSEDNQKSYHLLKSTLHALRDRLPVEEAAHLAAQLPMVIRGLYYHGWKPANTPQKMTKEEFLERVKSGLEFEPDRKVEELVNITLESLRKYITPGEEGDIKDVMPNDLKTIFPS